MNQPALKSILKGQNFEGFLLVRSAALRTGKTGTSFWDLTLCDRSMEVNAKVWTIPLFKLPEVGQIIKVRGPMEEFNGHAQLRINQIREKTDADPVDFVLLAPCAPKAGEDMFDEIVARVNAMQNQALKDIVLYRLNETKEKLLYAPAAMRLHHSERSGLLHHTHTMLRGADAICAIYTQLDRELLCAGIILHDLGKISEMIYDRMGVVSEYSMEGNLLGHIAQGIAKLDEAAAVLKTPRELTLMLEHMLLSHHDLPEYGSPKSPMFPEAEALHILDLLDARMYEMQQALETVEPGCFTEKIWSLDRKLYRRKETSGKKSAVKNEAADTPDTSIDM